MAKGARHDLKGKGKASERTYGKARDRTRGDKPRLIEDPEVEEKVLAAQLKEAHLYAANILGDGNCLFRALSDQLYGSPSMHHAIRQEICDYLASHPDKYRLFVDEDSVKGGFEGHVREMRQNGTYGTNLELAAFVARYRRPVKVYQPNLVYVLPVEDQGSSASASSSSTPPPPVPPPAAAHADAKLTPREKRLKARQDKMAAKGKGKERAAAAGAKSEPIASSAPEAAEPYDDSPLCIVYHSWEHYSSLRNISGPHTGPPRLRVGRVNSPAVADSTASSEAPADDDGDADPAAAPEEADDEDATMAESLDTIAPPPRRTSRGSPPADHPLPAIRTAISRRAKSSDGRGAAPPPPQPTIPVFPPSDSSASPSSPPSSSASSPPASAPASDTSTRPSKHLLDRSSRTLSLSRPRSHSPLSLSSSSSSVPAASPADSTASADADGDDHLDANDNDRAGPRTRSRLASPAGSSSSSSCSGTSTGVASSFAAAADGDGDGERDGDGAGARRASGSSTRASSVPSEGAPESSSPARVRKAPPPPPPKRERRGPTSAEKKEAARVRRLERRRAKGLGAQPVVGGAAGKDQGRVLRSGKRTSGAGDAGLGSVRELYI
ncbi:hypothetical protein DMC30DRAFT_266879 [Rhodotorula diobovata]|uniref:OTU domain-containing protein n=1 Tax=Rhodotorula diobovata TaxID=5288 RepID=A0A5C5FTI8_9BASI|nr:hypothetical protein DMC30DRAFT_266879 [Rhodotorula diobovata]